MLRTDCPSASTMAADVYGAPPTYHIIVDNAAGTGRGVRAVTVDATDVPDGEITLMDDAKAHAARVELG
jgi:hypothetical protein